MTSTIIIIPAALKPTLEQLIASHPAFPKRNPDGEFTAALYDKHDEAEETPTHWVLAHRFTDDQAKVVEALHQQFPDAVVRHYDFLGEPGAYKKLLTELGLKTKTSRMPGSL